MKIDFKSPYCEKVTFGAGKTTLYSDFDGTYMPFSHKNVCKKDGIVDRDSFDRVFGDFKQFSDKKGEKFSFNITSGRNLYEFLYFLDCLKKKDLNVPLPSKVISSNGADIFELSPEGQYISSEASLAKREKIKSVTNGWDGDLIKKDLSDILRKNGYEPIDSLINSSSAEYGGDFSMEASAKLQNVSKFASFRKDDSLIVSIGFPKSADYRELFYLKKEFLNYFKNNNLDVKIRDDGKGKYSGGFPVINISPIVYRTPLSKLYDTKLAVLNAASNDDLVIVAGDGPNDAEMLNPLNYISMPKDFDVFDSDKVAEFFAKYPQKRKELSRLPLAVIVIQEESSPPAISHKLADVLNSQGTPKIFYFKPGELQKGMEQLIDDYSKINLEFARNISEVRTNFPNRRFTKIDEKVFIGPQPGSNSLTRQNFSTDIASMQKDIEYLKDKGVGTIIDLRSPRLEGHFPILEGEMARKVGLQHFNIPGDGGIIPSKNQVYEFFDIMRNAEKPVYIHCREGKDRTGMMGCLYLAYIQDKSISNIFDEVFIKRDVTPMRYLNDRAKQEFKRQLAEVQKIGKQNNHDLNKLNYDQLEVLES